MNLHQDAVKIVRACNCANKTPDNKTMLEYTEFCMNYGAIEAAKEMFKLVSGVDASITKSRKDSEPHPETRQPVQYDPTIKT